MDHFEGQPFFSRKWRGAMFFGFIAAICVVLFLIVRNIPLGVFPFKSFHSSAEKIVNVVDIRFNDPVRLKSWREYVFNKKSEYKIEPDPNGEMVLHASSQGGYSIIFKTVNIPLETRPILAWEWRAEKFPYKAKRLNLGGENENDFAIRVCAIFAKSNPLVTDIVHYIWDDYFPAGTYAPSPYSKNVRMMVVTSGKPTSSKEWMTARRDVARDYHELFGKTHYSRLKAIAIISNSDDTQSESGAYLKRIWIESAHAERLHQNRHKIVDDVFNFLSPLRSFKRFPSSTYKAAVSGTVGQVEKITGGLRKQVKNLSFSKTKRPDKIAV